MKRHQGYRTSVSGKGAQCSMCGDWIPVRDEAVLMEPGVIRGDGSFDGNALTLHGILCMSCFDDLEYC